MVYGILTVYGVYEYYKPEVMQYGGRSWNAKTIEQYDGIVCNHLIPYLPDHNTRHIGMYMKQDYEEALNKLIKQGKNRPGEPFEPWEPDGIPEKVRYLMRAIVSTAAKHMLCDEVFGPRVITRTVDERERTGELQARNKKSFSVKQELAVYRYLMLNMDLTDGTAGLMLMYALGLRNNEACGINFGYIREFSAYPGHYYLYVPQSTELGTNTLKVLGKTRNSGRRIPMPDTLAKLLLELRQKREKLATERGYRGRGEDLPVACKKNNPTERCSADDLSQAAKTMYEVIGMRTAELVALNQELLEDAQAAKEEYEDDEFSEIEKDPSAYLMRRNFATHIAAVGLTDAEIHYVIGHKIEDEYIQRRAFGDEKMLYRIKLKMDQRPLLNDVQPDRCISVTPGSRNSINSSQKISMNLQAENMKEVRIHVTAEEPGDAIQFRFADGSDIPGIEVDYITYAADSKAEIQRTIDIVRYYQNRLTKNQEAT